MNWQRYIHRDARKTYAALTSCTIGHSEYFEIPCRPRPLLHPPVLPVVPAKAGTQRLTPEGAAPSPTEKVTSLARTHVFSGFAAVRSDGVACVGWARLRHCSRRCHVAERAAGPHPRRSGSTVAWERMPLRGHVLWLTPRRARAPGGGSRFGLRASARTPGRPGRPPAGLIRPARSVPQVASRVGADGSPHTEVACWESIGVAASAHTRTATYPSLPPTPSPPRCPCARRGPAPQFTSKPITHHRLVAFASAVASVCAVA